MVKPRSHCHDCGHDCPRLTVDSLVGTRERTIRLAADTIRFDSMQRNIGRFNTDTIRLLNCLLDVTTTMAATAEQNIDAETLPRQVPREKEERARKKEDRGEVPRKTAAGGMAATTSSFMQLAHRCRNDGRVIVSYEP